MRLFAGILCVVLLLAFYIGWPVYAGYEIRNALAARDTAALAAKVDFDQLKESLRPAAQAEAERTMKQHLAEAGTTAGVLGEQIAQRALPGLVEVTLRALVTPNTLIRVYDEGGSAKEVVARTVNEQFVRYGGVTGLGAAGMAQRLEEEAARAAGTTASGGGSVVRTVTSEPPPPVRIGTPVKTVGAAPAEAAAEPAKPTFGISNIKSFGPAGPLSMELGIAKDASAADADVTIEMSFTGTGWKLTGLRPRI